MPRLLPPLWALLVSAACADGGAPIRRFGAPEGLTVTPIPVEGNLTHHVGVTRDPSDGALYLARAGGTLERLEGEARVQVGRGTLAPFGQEVTDLAALGDGRFLSAVQGVGYVADPVGGGDPRPFFCYEPEDWEEGGEDFDWTRTWQVTDALAVDPESGVIVAAPQTWEEENEEEPRLLRTDFAVFELATGRPISWTKIPAGRAPGALTAVGDGVFVFAIGDRLSQYDAATDNFFGQVRLDALGVGAISGVAWDPSDDALIVLSPDTGMARVTGWR